MFKKHNTEYKDSRNHDFFHRKEEYLAQTPLVNGLTKLHDREMYDSTLNTAVQTHEDMNQMYHNVT